MELQKFNIDQYTFLAFPKLWNEGFYHCFTTGDLNMGFSTGSSFEDIGKKLKFIAKYWSIEPAEVFAGYQIHGNNVEIIEHLESGDEYGVGRIFFDTDGMITDLPDVLLYTKYADCVPLLFFDPVTKTQANVHSGWKGTAKHIGKYAVEKLVKEKKVNVQDLMVIIGPSIHQDAFEVEKDVVDLYRKSYPEIAEDIIYQRTPIKYHIDLQQANRWLLNQCGVLDENIYEVEYCTHDTPWLHSYRRDGKDYQLMAAISILHPQ